MSENKISREISFVKMGFDPEQPAVRKPETVTKVATFNELNQFDRSQHRFHGRLFAFYVSQPLGDESDDDKGIMSINTNGIYDLTVAYVKAFHVPDGEFSAKDRELLLNDSTALYNLGFALMKEVFTPFFLASRGVTRT